MANIRVDVGYAIHDGSELKFRSPVDCSAITGLIVYYPGEDGNLTSKVFVLADAHGNNVGDIDHLFAENVVVKVILDVTTGMAFVQNADTNAYLEGHIQNKANPHGVTASQVGARSDTWMPTAADVGARPSTWTPTASDVGARPSTWLPTLAEIGAAPAGYGLGTTGVVKTISALSELDAIVSNGWYTIYSPNALSIGGVAFHSITLEVSMYNTTQGYQIVRFLGNNIVCKRAMYSGAWRDWEFDNPPMELGKEYRTTERYNGKPVYARLVNLGTMPNATSKTYYDLAIGVDDIVSAEFIYKTIDTRFFNNPDISWYIGCYNNPYIVMTSTKDMSGCTGYLLCKYTKKAD